MHKLLVVLIVCTFSLTAEDLWCYQNAPLKKGPIHLVVSPDNRYLNAELKAYFQELLQTYLIRDGHKVIERVQLEEIQSEKSGDQQNAVQDSMASVTPPKTASKTHLQRIGELGADAILLFSSYITSSDDEAELKEIGFRLVDCKTGFVHLAGHVEEDNPTQAARLIAFTLNAASKKGREIIGEKFSERPDDLNTYSYFVRIDDEWYAYKVRKVKK